MKYKIDFPYPLLKEPALKLNFSNQIYFNVR